MKNVRIILLVLLAAAFAGCQKDEAGKTVANQEVSFAIEHLVPGGLKQLPLCQTDIQGNQLMPSVLEIDIFDQEIGLTSTITPQVFVLDGKLYSQAIKLAPGTYTITRFLLLTHLGGTIVMAIPESGSEFSQYISNGVELEFEVSAFDKVQVDIQVLCFSPETVEAFGFTWFQVNDVIIRQQCFFGDLCIKDPADYANSYYENLFAPLSDYPFDLPAIFKIEVSRNDGDWVKTYSNITIENNVATDFTAPLCVSYPDRLNKDDLFIFDLYIYVKQGDGFGFKYFHTWTFQNDESIENGGDGVVGFVVGNCNYMGADLTLAPYQNLPASANITITKPGNPGFVNMFVNTLNPTGNYDLPLGEMAGWSGNMDDADAPDGTFNRDMYVYSSFYTTQWPVDVTFSLQDIAKVNWLFNNIGSFDGFNPPAGNTITPADISPEQGTIIQNAIWEIIHGGTGAAGLAFDMADAAADKGNFVPLPGGWAAIICLSMTRPVQHQLIFTVVDP